MNPKDVVGSQKPALSLVPPVAMIHEAMALRAGAEKYGRANWRHEKISATLYVDAMLRHIVAWLDGEECSHDTHPPVHHLAHVRATSGIIIDAMENGCLVDDRPSPGAAAELLREFTMGQNPAPVAPPAPDTGCIVVYVGLNHGSV